MAASNGLGSRLGLPEQVRLCIRAEAADTIGTMTSASAQIDPPPGPRGEILARLAELARTVPGQRFGRTVDFVGFMAECETGRGIADLEDDQFLASLRQFQADRERSAAWRSKHGFENVTAEVRPGETARLNARAEDRPAAAA